jgi:hypothetical protein
MCLEILINQLNVPETESKVLVHNIIWVTCVVWAGLHMKVCVFCAHGVRCVSASEAIHAYLKILKRSQNTVSLQETEQYQNY